MDPEAQSQSDTTTTMKQKRVATIVITSIVITTITIDLLLITLLWLINKPEPSTDLTFTIESTTVKAYNLTSDDRRLSWALNLGIRAHNPLTYTSVDLSGFDLEVRKGPTRHKLLEGLQESLRVFRLCPGCQSLIHVEGEIADDVAVGEGRFDVVMQGHCSYTYHRTHDVVFVDLPVNATCKDVVLDFARSGERVQKVDCKVTSPILGL